METVLVVGRMPILDDELTKSLEGSGFRLTETQDPGEALSICEDSRPAIAFVEVDSPDSDHFGLLPQMRDALKHGRIVAICNRYSEALDDYCEELGADLALPQVTDRTRFNLFVRGLMTLIPSEP